MLKTIRADGDPGQNTVIGRLVRMCLLPQSRASEVRGPFMVRTLSGSNRIKGRAARIAHTAALSLKSTRFLSKPTGFYLLVKLLAQIARDREKLLKRRMSERPNGH